MKLVKKTMHDEMMCDAWVCICILNERHFSFPDTDADP